MEEAAPDDEGPHFSEMDPTGRFGRWDQVLGRGAFKVVYKAFDTQEGTEVAWNQVRVSELMSTKDAENKEERDRLFAEIRVLKALKHKNIMSFFDSWYDAKTYTVNFITELFTSGTLRQYRKRHKHIDEEVVKRWAWQILCGLVYLHGHNPPIIHRDLKCDNIFINGSDGVVKIGDLGLATMLRSRTAPQSVLGTPEFMAPELYEEEYDDRVDVYSFGMCLLELSTMEYPYSECKNAAQIYRKVSLGVRPAGLQKVASPDLAEFINVCISAREARPRARQLLKHSYFDSIRKDKALVSSRSDAALAAAGGVGSAGSGTGSSAGAEYGSEYGSVASGPVSRTTSSLNEMIAAVGSAGHPGPLSGPPSASSGVGLSSSVPAQAPVLPPQHALSRSISAEAVSLVGAAVHSDKAQSDSASVRSQRSNVSELASLPGMLENIAEEGEASDGGEDAEGGASTPRIVLSRQASPHGSPQPACASPAKPGSPTSSDGCRCDATERRFAVKGNWLDGDKRIQLRLRICEPTGMAQTVEFEFDVAVDTASDVASEMVAELELTPEDAAVIATCIRDELARLSALPEINAHASMSLAKAAAVLENSLTSSALEQAYSSGTMRDLMPMNGAPSMEGRLHSGRFSEEVLSAPAPPHVAAAAQLLAAPTPAPPLAAVLEVQAAAAAGAPSAQPPAARTGSNRSSFERETPVPVFPGLQPSGGSTCSLASVSSVSSIPHSITSAGSQAPSEPAHLATAAAAHAPTLGRLSPRGSGPADARLAGLAGLQARPVSPLGIPQAAAAPVDMPSPSQRVLRSNSVDAFSLLSRSSSMPPGREALASPLGVGSGALSPTSGILSPSTTVHEKRIPLNKLFENLQDLAAARTDSPGLEAAMAAAAAPPLPPNLPPLPHPAGGRPLPPSNSHSVLESGGGGASGEHVGALLRPRSEACLTALPRLSSFGTPTISPPASAPSGGGELAAAVALSEAAPMAGALASPTCASTSASPRLAVADTIKRLDLQSSAPIVAAAVSAAYPPPALARPGAHALSAPPSKLPSRDSSPVREGSLSPTRPPTAAAQLLGATSSGDIAGQLNGKRPPIKDKEALRRQAAESMKAVELRALNLLEGGLGMGKATRGVPMAAAKGSVGLAGAPMGSANGIGATGTAAPQPPAMAAQQQQQHSVPPLPRPQQHAAPPPLGAQQQMGSLPLGMQQQLPLKQQQQQHPAVAVAASGVPVVPPPPAAPLAMGQAAVPAPHIAVPAPAMAPAAALAPPPLATGP